MDEGIRSMKLDEAHRLKLINLLINDQLITKDKEAANMMAQIANLRMENANLRSQVHERTVNSFYLELGLNRSDNLELKDDGTLIIKDTRPRPIENKPLDGIAVT